MSSLDSIYTKFFMLDVPLYTSARVCLLATVSSTLGILTLVNFLCSCLNQNINIYKLILQYLILIYGKIPNFMLVSSDLYIYMLRCYNK